MELPRLIRILHNGRGTLTQLRYFQLNVKDIHRNTNLCLVLHSKTCCIIIKHLPTFLLYNYKLQERWYWITRWNRKILKTKNTVKGKDTPERERKRDIERSARVREVKHDENERYLGRIKNVRRNSYNKQKTHTWQQIVIIKYARLPACSRSIRTTIHRHSFTFLPLSVAGSGYVFCESMSVHIKLV